MAKSKFDSKLVGDRHDRYRAANIRPGFSELVRAECLHLLINKSTIGPLID